MHNKASIGGLFEIFLFPNTTSEPFQNENQLLIGEGRDEGGGWEGEGEHKEKN